MGCCCEDDKKEIDVPSDKNRLFRPNVCCTDIIFLIVYILFWAGLIFIAVFSILHGDPRRLVYGYDSYGNTCNMENANITNITHSGMNTMGKKHVFFMNIFNPRDSLEICVSACPNKTMTEPHEVQEYARQTGIHLCHYNISVDDYKKKELYDANGAGPCPALPVWVSTSTVSRCIPDWTSIAWKELNSSEFDGIVAFLNADNFLKKIFADFFKCWKEMIYLSLIALAASYLMVLLLQFLAAIIVWVIVVLATIASLVGTGVLWWTYVDIRSNRTQKQKELNVPILDVQIKNEHAFLGFAIVATVITVLLIILVILMRKRFQLVVALFREAGRCVMAMPVILIQPLFTFIFMAIYLAGWFVIMAFLVTSDDAIADTSYDPPRVKFDDHVWVRYMWWYYIVALIWVTEFILASHQFVIVGATTLWYFMSPEKKKSLCCSCMTSKATSRLILHHLGSVAFGAFIITLVKLPRYILMYIHEKLDRSKETSEIAKACLQCCVCCLWCLEKILKYVNQNAYTVIAMKGTNFCSAAKKALAILVTNPLRVAAINTVGSFTLFLGKVGVAAAMCAVAARWFKTVEGVHFYFVPTLFITFVAYLIAHCFLTVYEMIIDALLICFCYECEKMEHNESYQPYMSKELLKMIQTTSRGIDVADGKVPAPEEDVVDGREIETLRHSLRSRRRPKERGSAAEQSELQPVKTGEIV